MIILPLFMFHCTLQILPFFVFVNLFHPLLSHLEFFLFFFSYLYIFLASFFCLIILYFGFTNPVRLFNLVYFILFSSNGIHFVRRIFMIWQRTLRAGKLTERVLQLFIDTGKDEVFSLIQALNIRVTLTPVLPTSKSFLEFQIFAFFFFLQWILS